MTVERTTLAPGLDISRAVTGLWQIADLERGTHKPSLEDMAAAMRPYAEAGLTTFDMADHYGSAEEVAGLFAAEFGMPVERLTKWVPQPGPVTEADVRAAVERALTRLKTERLDLLQFHTWSYADPTWLDCLFWLQDLKREGLIGHLGLTNFDAAHLNVASASGVELASNQVCYSLLDQRPAQGLSALCRARGVKLLAYGTVAGGFLSERWLRKPDPGLDGLQTWSQMKYYRFIQAAGGWEPYQALLETLHHVAARHGVAVATVASRFILEDPAVGGVIIGARLGSSAHIEDTLQLFGFALDDASRAEITAAMRALTPLPGDSGDEYRKPPFLTASGDLSHHVESFPTPFAVQKDAQGRTRALSGTSWEAMAGFSRAVRSGDRVLVSGTTATHRDRLIGGDDAAAQFHFAVDKVEGALHSLGATLDDVVRTRVYVRDLADWEAVARAHGARFSSVQPANTLVRADLVGEEYLVEVEAEALVGGPH